MLDVSLTAMITTIVVFLALIYFLNIKLYRPLLLHMEKREAIIKEDEANAMKNAQDADADKAEIVRIMDAAKLQARWSCRVQNLLRLTRLPQLRCVLLASLDQRHCG